MSGSKYFTAYVSEGIHASQAMNSTCSKPHPSILPPPRLLYHPLWENGIIKPEKSVDPKPLLRIAAGLLQSADFSTVKQAPRVHPHRPLPQLCSSVITDRFLFPASMEPPHCHHQSVGLLCHMTIGGPVTYSRKPNTTWPMCAFWVPYP